MPFWQIITCICKCITEDWGHCKLIREQSFTHCPTRVTKHTFDTKSHPLIYIYFRSNALANLASMCMVIYAWEWLEDRSCFKSNTKHFKIHSVHDKSFGLLPYPLAFSPSFYSMVSGEAGAFFIGLNFRYMGIECTNSLPFLFLS